MGDGLSWPLWRPRGDFAEAGDLERLGHVRHTGWCSARTCTVRAGTRTANNVGVTSGRFCSWIFACLLVCLFAPGSMSRTCLVLVITRPRELWALGTRMQMQQVGSKRRQGWMVSWSRLRPSSSLVFRYWERRGNGEAGCVETRWLYLVVQFSLVRVVLAVSFQFFVPAQSLPSSRCTSRPACMYLFVLVHVPYLRYTYSTARNRGFPSHAA
ncbi:hypothetical protein J3F83DRAFT_504641 [Trichoderma novae-zelandiae]